MTSVFERMDASRSALAEIIASVPERCKNATSFVAVTIQTLPGDMENVSAIDIIGGGTRDDLLIASGALIRSAILMVHQRQKEGKIHRRDKIDIELMEELARVIAVMTGSRDIGSKDIQ